MVPSYNQAAFLRETLQSLVDQNLPGLEVIIQDDRSTDDSVKVAREFVDRHPDIFKLFIAEKNSGQAAALNAGFARAQADIMGFLNSDDTLYPGCLARVVREIDPARNRYVVFGRCLFTGEGSRYVGVEHPAEFTSHFELLAIWKRRYNTLPQPSVFWHRKVFERCGGLDPSARHVLDYDLFCRFSRHFHFYRVDELWSTYRMHHASRSSLLSEDEVLAMSVAISRRYWGSWLSPLRWRCEVSHWLHDRHLHEHACHHARRAEEAARAGRRFAAIGEFVRTFFYSPTLAWHRLFRAWIESWRIKFLERLLFSPDQGFTGHYADGWIGPVHKAALVVPADASRLVVRLRFVPQPGYGRVGIRLKLDGKLAVRHSAEAEGEFTLEADLSRFRKNGCRLEVLSDAFFVPSKITDSPDTRQLSLMLLDCVMDRGSEPHHNSAST